MPEVCFKQPKSHPTARGVVSVFQLHYGLSTLTAWPLTPFLGSGFCLTLTTNTTAAGAPHTPHAASGTSLATPPQYNMACHQAVSLSFL